MSNLKNRELGLPCRRKYDVRDVNGTLLLVVTGTKGIPDGTLQPNNKIFRCLSSLSFPIHSFFVTRLGGNKSKGRLLGNSILQLMLS